MRRRSNGLFDLGLQEDARTHSLTGSRDPGEIEGRRQDREADDRDQQAQARGDQRREDREPDDAHGEIEQEVGRLEIRPALGQRGQEGAHSRNLTPPRDEAQPGKSSG